MLQKLLWLATAGAVGTLARYGFGGWVQRLAGQGFPWGTLAVNAVGCFLFGLIWTLADERLLIRGETRFILLTGWAGAFTTYSTFAFESTQMLRDTEWLAACANVLAHLAVGLLLMFAGMAVGRWGL
jgi:CrcB protein